jgi:hypothetical protein
MREGWIQPTYSCWGDRESKQPRQLENIWNRIAWRRKNKDTVKLDKWNTNKPLEEI